MLKKEAKSWAPEQVSKSVQARDQVSDVNPACLTVLNRTSGADYGSEGVILLFLVMIEALGGWCGARVQSRLGGFSCLEGVRDSRDVQAQPDSEALMVVS